MFQGRRKTALGLLIAPLCLVATLLAPGLARVEQVTLHWL